MRALGNLEGTVNASYENLTQNLAALRSDLKAHRLESVAVHDEMVKRITTLEVIKERAIGASWPIKGAWILIVSLISGIAAYWFTHR